MGSDNVRISRERDRRLLELLELHPLTNDQLVAWGIFPARKKARERTLKAKIPYVYLVKDLDGYDVKLFSLNPVSKPEHEYRVSELIIASKAQFARRGWQVDSYLSDAELVTDGIVYRLECDLGGMSMKRLAERVAKYHGCPDPVYWVFDTQARAERFVNQCSPPPHHYATTYRQAVENFYGPIWTAGTDSDPDPDPEGDPDRSIG